MKYCSTITLINSCIINTQQQLTVGIVDSGISGQYGPLNIHTVNKFPCRRKIEVSLSNNAIISLTYSTYLNIRNILKVASKVFIFLNIHDRLLLDVSQFGANKYTVEFWHVVHHHSGNIYTTYNIWLYKI